MALGTCWLPKESSQFDETIENCVVWRMNIFMLIELKEDQSGHAPYDAVLDGFVDSGRFLGQQASSE